MRIKSVNASSLVHMVENDYSVIAWCSNEVYCRNRREVDLDALLDRFGPDYCMVTGSPSLRDIMVCAACGARHPKFIIMPYSLAGLDKPKAGYYQLGG